MIRSVIDIGTNSVRLYVADDDKCITKELATTRLGEGISKSRIMSDIPMRRTADAICTFVQKARKVGSEQIFIYATAMVRESSNKQVFIDMVKERCGITLEVIPGETEAQIAYLGAAKGKVGYAVIDIGGGSTEVVTKQNGVYKALSQKVGCVRLKESFGKEDGTVDVQQVYEYVKKHFVPGFEVTGVADARGIIGVSGTATTIASLDLGLKNYQPSAIQDYSLKRDSIKAEIDKMASMTNDQRIQYMGDFADRADIIVFGGILLLSFIDYYGFATVSVSDRDSLEGFLEYKDNQKHA